MDESERDRRIRQRREERERQAAEYAAELAGAHDVPPPPTMPARAPLRSVGTFQPPPNTRLGQDDVSEYASYINRARVATAELEEPKFNLDGVSGRLGSLLAARQQPVQSYESDGHEVAPPMHRRVSFDDQAYNDAPAYVEPTARAPYTEPFVRPAPRTDSRTADTRATPRVEEPARIVPSGMDADRERSLAAEKRRQYAQDLQEQQLFKQNQPSIETRQPVRQVREVVPPEPVRSIPQGLSASEARALELEKQRRYASELRSQQQPDPRAARQQQRDEPITTIPLGMSEGERRAFEAEKRRAYAAELQAQMQPPTHSRQMNHGSRHETATSIPLGLSDADRKALEAEKRRAYAAELQAQMQQKQRISRPQPAEHVLNYSQPQPSYSQPNQNAYAPSHFPSQSYAPRADFRQLETEDEDAALAEKFAAVLGLPGRGTPTNKPAPVPQYYSNAPAAQSYSNDYDPQPPSYSQSKPQYSNAQPNYPPPTHAPAAREPSEADKKAQYRLFLEQQMVEAQKRKDAEKRQRELDEQRAQQEAIVQQQLAERRRGGGGEPFRDDSGRPIARLDQLHALRQQNAAQPPPSMQYEHESVSPTNVYEQSDDPKAKQRAYAAELRRQSEEDAERKRAERARLDADELRLEQQVAAENASNSTDPTGMRRGADPLDDRPRGRASMGGFGSGEDHRTAVESQAFDSKSRKLEEKRRRQQEEAAEEARIIAERALLAKKYTEEIERERRKGQGPAASQSADIVVAAPKPRVAAPSESEPAAVSDFRADLAAQRAADRQRKDAEARRRAEEEAMEDAKLERERKALEAHYAAEIEREKLRKSSIGAVAAAAKPSTPKASTPKPATPKIDSARTSQPRLRFAEQAEVRDLEPNPPSPDPKDEEYLEEPYQEPAPQRSRPAVPPLRSNLYADSAYPNMYQQPMMPQMAPPPMAYHHQPVPPLVSRFSALLDRELQSAREDPDLFQNDLNNARSAQSKLERQLAALQRPMRFDSNPSSDNYRTSQPQSSASSLPQWTPLDSDRGSSAIHQQRSLDTLGRMRVGGAAPLPFEMPWSARLSGASSVAAALAHNQPAVPPSPSLLRDLERMRATLADQSNGNEKASRRPARANPLEQSMAGESMWLSVADEEASMRASQQLISQPELSARRPASAARPLISVSRLAPGSSAGHRPLFTDTQDIDSSMRNDSELIDSSSTLRPGTSTTEQMNLLGSPLPVFDAPFSPPPASTRAGPLSPQFQWDATPRLSRANVTNSTPQVAPVVNVAAPIYSARAPVATVPTKQPAPAPAPAVVVTALPAQPVKKVHESVTFPDTHVAASEYDDDAFEEESLSHASAVPVGQVTASASAPPPAPLSVPSTGLAQSLADRTAAVAASYASPQAVGFTSGGSVTYSRGMGAPAAAPIPSRFSSMLASLSADEPRDQNMPTSPLAQLVREHDQRSSRPSSAAGRASMSDDQNLVASFEMPPARSRPTSALTSAGNSIAGPSFSSQAPYSAGFTPSDVASPRPTSSNGTRVNAPTITNTDDALFATGSRPASSFARPWSSRPPSRTMSSAAVAAALNSASGLTGVTTGVPAPSSQWKL